MNQQVASIIAKLSTQGPLLNAAHKQYEEVLSAYRNRQEPNQVLQDELEQARLKLSAAKELWSKLCDELLNAGQSAESDAQPANTGNPLIDKMMVHAQHVKDAKKAFQPVHDEYRSKEHGLHAANDIAGLQEIRTRLDPLHAAANQSMQSWGGLCDELLLSFAQSTPPTETAAPAAC